MSATPAEAAVEAHARRRSAVVNAIGYEMFKDDHEVEVVHTDDCDGILPCGGPCRIVLDDDEQARVEAAADRVLTELDEHHVLAWEIPSPA